VWKTGTSQNEYLAVPFAVLVGEVLIMEWIKIVYKKGKNILRVFISQAGEFKHHYL
jgi:hypothetical protein